MAYIHSDRHSGKISTHFPATGSYILPCVCVCLTIVWLCSEDERDFTRLLETVEGRAALAEEEEKSLGRLEARQTQRGGVLAWLLPYHDLDVSEDEDEEAEDLQVSG